jgi:hypothetical protein
MNTIKQYRSASKTGCAHSRAAAKMRSRTVFSFFSSRASEGDERATFQ